MPGIAVIARQRSGTNFLRTLIANSSNLTNLGEVFDINAARSNLNFFTFRRDRDFVQPELREAADCTAELAEFFDTLSARHARHIIDIKYNQTLVSAPTYFSFTDPYPVFEALAARDYCVLHLVRDSVCASIVSGLVANRTGQFHVVRNAVEGAPAALIHVPPFEFANEIGRREREIALFDRFCAEQARHMRVRYEDVADASPEALTDLLTPLCALGGGSFVRLGESAFKKGLGHWLDYVENANEIVAYLAADPALRRHVADLPERSPSIAEPTR
jgi:hypothetical protein